MCAFGRQVRSDVTMEEVCCRFAKCRRRTSSLTLTLPRPKLVRLEILKIVWVAPGAERGARTLVRLHIKLRLNRFNEMFLIPQTHTLSSSSEFRTVLFFSTAV